ncbi:transmembrane protein 256 homolog [Solanum tuberosum]|uniref:Transmembrane protein 256 homolog n=2 Tax=Solanum TaxID=4107 RepID=M1A6E0_SOLTU|nr:PREDICTED: transmembrane protein 256 homolog [Solanum tuberosum]
MSRGNRLMLRRPNLNKVAKIKTSSSKNQKSSKMDPQIWHKIAAISGVAAVGLGAYGAHGFKPQNPTYKEVWHTASLYHLVHTAALLAAPITKHPNIFGGLLTGGIMAFSGTCYAVALLEDRKYSTLAPFGGFAFIAAWASLLF